jgi:hypothetical protein
MVSLIDIFRYYNYGSSIREQPTHFTWQRAWARSPRNRYSSEMAGIIRSLRHWFAFRNWRGGLTKWASATTKQEGLSSFSATPRGWLGRLEIMSETVSWIYAGVANWYGAAILGGLLILIAERFDKRREPSEADVRRAAERYRQHYREQAFTVIDDHVLGVHRAG